MGQISPDPNPTPPAPAPPATATSAADGPGPSAIPTATSFATQANALFRKNITFQKRNVKTNCCIISFPIAICLLLLGLQLAINVVFQGSDFNCGCESVPFTDGRQDREKKCGVEYSTESQAPFCAIDQPPVWPAFLQLPAPSYRSVQQSNSGQNGLPPSSCRADGTCPVTFLYTGRNRSFAEGIASLLIQTSDASVLSNSTDVLDILSSIPVGTSTWPGISNILEPAVLSPQESYILLPNCPVSNVSITLPIGSRQFQAAVPCVKQNILWRNNYSVIDTELYEGFRGGNPSNQINEVSAVFDFGSTSAKKFDVTIAYNRTYKNDSANSPPGLVRVSRSMNMASQAFLRTLLGSDSKLPLSFVTEMPKPKTTLKLDFASILGPLFYEWVVQLLFPVILTALVYEKENNLRIMMKMHGLGDGPYWLITYCYFLALSTVYVLLFVFFGSVVDLKFFRLNSYSIQFVFYFIYVNLQIALAFLLSTIFSNVRTATVFGYIYVFGSGLLGNFLFGFFVQDKSFSGGAIFAMELLPPFSLYRGLWEFSQYSFIGNYKGIKGMEWTNLSDSQNGMKDVLGIMSVEWVLFLLVAYYLDQVLVSGSGVKKNPLFFLNGILHRKRASQSRPSEGTAVSDVTIDVQKQDVFQEAQTVRKLLSASLVSHSIVCDDIKKVYPGRDGNPPKHAVKGLSLAITRGECFGMLGPNGAGKTTSISMMIGLVTPTSGSAFIEGLDIREDLDKIYSFMGVCPQHDLLWETLTGREHLLFYGRLKNLKNDALYKAVDDGLKSVNLFNGGVGDKQAGKYSGGMKRRLSVAISLIGNPKVVYMDEPSTGLDPASRSNLWSVIKEAKQDKAIILTTHSMEEAETLCDRVGIFVSGELQCIGNSKELKSRYGGSYVFSITTAQHEEQVIVEMVQKISPNARKVYGLAGTQKFELPKSEVTIADVFRTVENTKTKFNIQAWGLADTTLEDVFIKIANESNKGEARLS